MKGGAQSFIWILMAMVFILITISSLLSVYPRSAGFECDAITPGQDVGITDFANALFTGCGPSWLLILFLVPVAMVLIIWVAPFIGGS